MKWRFRYAWHSPLDPPSSPRQRPSSWQPCHQAAVPGPFPSHTAYLKIDPRQSGVESIPVFPICLQFKLISFFLNRRTYFLFWELPTPDMYNIKGVLSRPHSVQFAVHHGPYKPGGCGVDGVQVLLGVLTGLLENQGISRTTTLISTNNIF